MRTKLIAITLFAVCLSMAGRTAATSGSNTPLAEPTQQPVSYLPLVMNQARGGESMPAATVGLSGTVYLNPRWALPQPPAQPVLYQVIFDATGSMSYDFAGHGTIGGTAAVGQDTVGGTDYQCQPNQ